MEKYIGVNHGLLRQISNGDLNIQFVTTGDIHMIKYGNLILNQLTGQEIDGSIANIYLRIHESGYISSFPLIGKESPSRFFIGKSEAKWLGRVADVNYEVTLKLGLKSWFWQVDLDAIGKIIDLVYVNDLGLADESTLHSNEAYNSQYLNHQVFDTHGFKIMTRQNQAQSTGFPTLETGGFGEWIVDGYATDGFQFFGKSYKATRVPELLEQTDFPNEVYQYELALTVLKTKRIKLNGFKQAMFYHILEVDSAAVPTHVSSEQELQNNLSSLTEEQVTEQQLPKSKMKLNQQINGRLLTNVELEGLHPNSKFEEVIDHQLLSGFTTTNTHFVSLAKELLVEREHGEIFLSGNSTSIKNRGLSTSSFIYGLFNAHIVIGNTTMNKLLSNQRDHLNLHLVSGQRIFIKLDGTYQMLGLPSVFEMGYNFAKWTYVLENDTLVITNFAGNNEASLQLELVSQEGRTYDFLVLNQITMDEVEYKSSAKMATIGNNSFDFTAGKGSSVLMGNPDLRYRMSFDQKVVVLNPETLFDQPTFIENSLVIYSLSSNQFKIKITGSLDGTIKTTDFLNFNQEINQYKGFIEEELLNGFKFVSKQKRLEKINTILPWYAHDMMIHYLSPHGLEQYGGAAWGTRDVSQGPIEFFLSTQHPKVVREILLVLFSHQFEDDGNWPQWFMFDEYQPILASESHGDVIVWPVFALSEYLEQTGDFGILDEVIPYVSRETNQFTTKKVNLWAHVNKELEYIKTHFLKGTHLSIYGNGDWDDTLQPADSQLSTHMTSSWTDALTYQAMKKFAKMVEIIHPQVAAELNLLAAQIKADFEKYLVIDGIISGFALQDINGSFEAIIHPQDTKTKMHYRLLPMNRSMISELASFDQMKRNTQLIDDHLTFRDGVRLMEHSPEYKGGVSVNFKRAEQSANFGREIGLLYTHAQIRYVEAMTKVGRTDIAWKALEQTIPVALHDLVGNAEPRQANVYFSSSDGDFKTRYEAQDNFDKLKNGMVGVKGGWRLYSSGPGIFTNQLITHLAGFEMTSEYLKIDPALLENEDALDFDFTINNKKVHFKLNKTDHISVLLDGESISANSLKNLYRSAGIKINKDQLTRIHNNSVITITL